MKTFPMIDWQQRFHQFIAEWLIQQGKDVKEVTEVYEFSYDGCPTCTTTEFEVNIDWISNSGERYHDVFPVSLSNLFK